MDRPLVSVIIPVYNGERYLAEAIESVLAQDYSPVEVIVVDDGSTDGSALVAKGFGPPVRYHFQPNDRVAAARNSGVALAGGDFLAFLDADDLWTADKLTRQMAAFNAGPDLDMVFGHAVQFHSPDLRESEKKRVHCPSQKMPGYIPGAMLVGRDAFSRAGRFDTSLKSGEFVDWYLRATEKGLKGVMLPEVVYRRRLHGRNRSILERESKAEFVRIIKSSLDRRRSRR